MKLFGEYLVEKKIIDEASLLKALIEQVRSTPSTLEAAFETQVLTQGQLLAVLKHQHAQCVGFLEALQALNLKSEGVVEKIREYSTKKRIPLGQTLVQMGAADLEAITKALDDYLAEVETEQKVP